jgi:hypothetical protein
MDEALTQQLKMLGIDPRNLPAGTVGLLHREQIATLGDDPARWVMKPHNSPALAYEIETEHKRHVGLALRNLYSGKPHASHHTVTNETELPLWHNWTPALPTVWNTGVIVLVEGPKDARVLHTHGIQAVAYLSNTPTQQHLKVIQRYAHTIIWIPDNEPLDDKVKRRHQQIATTAQQFKLNLRQFRIPAKDPAELAQTPDEIHKIREKVQAASKLGGGGYRAPSRQLGEQVPAQNSQ